MAVIWQTCRNGVIYEVRGAGSSVRLYSNGTFHSQWNPRHIFTGALWDLLTLPGFLLPASRPLRVLVLGVGGGAVIRQLRALLEVEEVVGVELDSVHLQIARRWFGLSHFDNVKLHHADARDWIDNYKGKHFDIVIDDLFGHVAPETQRSVVIDKDWSQQVASVLSPESVLVVNTVSRHERQAIEQLLRPAVDDSLAGARQSCVRAGYNLRHRLYENHIVVLHRSPKPRGTFQWRKQWIAQVEAQVRDGACQSAARNHLQQASRWYIA